MSKTAEDWKKERDEAEWKMRSAFPELCVPKCTCDD